jgi:hypothetical protein
VLLGQAAQLVGRAVLGRHDYRGEGDDPVTFTVQEGATVDQVAVALEEEDSLETAASELIWRLSSYSPGCTKSPAWPSLKTSMKRMDETFQILSESTGHSVQDFEDAAEDPTQYGISDDGGVVGRLLLLHQPRDGGIRAHLAIELVLPRLHEVARTTTTAARAMTR